MEVDINAPIIPYEGLGGIKLYSTREELKDILVSECIEYNKKYGSIQCTLKNNVSLVFNEKNQKLRLISAEVGYKGKLYEKIGLGMLEKEFFKLCPNFVFEDFEELWIDYQNCISIVTDAESSEIIQINLFIPESELGSFEEGNW